MVRLLLWSVVCVLLASVAIAREELNALLSKLAQGMVDERTVDALQAAVRQDPNAPAWWAWLGFAHALRREWEAAATAYQKAKALNAQPSFPWFPPSLPKEWLPQHGNLQLVTVGSLQVWQSPLVFAAPFPRLDPQRGAPFHRVAFVYSEDAKTTVARQWVQWFAQQPIPPHLMEVPAVFAAALRWLSEGLGTPIALPVRVWLFERGDGSAFSSAQNTFFYGTLPPDRWSWWLKAAHEAGHHAVPAFGEFDGLHEPYSGGFLGERLFALWLWTKGGYPSELCDPLTTYLRKTVCAEMVMAQQWLLRTQGKEPPPMRAFLGLCTFLERLGGTELLREVIKQANGDSWEAFQKGCQQAIVGKVRDGLTLILLVPDANTAVATFNLEALKEGNPSPTLQLAWWLPIGNYRCTVTVEGHGTLQLRWGDELVTEWVLPKSPHRKEVHATFANERAEWQRLRFWWQTGSGKILSVTFQTQEAAAKNLGGRSP